ncbi:MAG: hypothetical protein ABW178_01620 [Pseudoxanthomonas sp.]
MAGQSLDIEDRLFRRGVSDQEVRQATELVREYIEAHRADLFDVPAWAAFGDFYEELTRNLSVQQIAAFEIAVDTLLVGVGALRWSAAQEALAASRRAIVASSLAARDPTPGA